MKRQAIDMERQTLEKRLTQELLQFLRKRAQHILTLGNHANKLISNLEDWQLESHVALREVLEEVEAYLNAILCLAFSQLDNLNEWLSEES